jgi:hypothetical protein
LPLRADAPAPAIKLPPITPLVGAGVLAAVVAGKVFSGWAVAVAALIVLCSAEGVPASPLLWALTGVGVALAGVGVGAATGVLVGGADGVLVGGTAVAVGGTGVFVGGTAVLVGCGVAVGGTAVAVGGTAVLVGGTAVAVGGTEVAVGIAAVVVAGRGVGLAPPTATVTLDELTQTRLVSQTWAVLLTEPLAFLLSWTTRTSVTLSPAWKAVEVPV